MSENVLPKIGTPGSYEGRETVLAVCGCGRGASLYSDSLEREEGPEACMEQTNELHATGITYALGDDGSLIVGRVVTRAATPEEMVDIVQDTIHQLQETIGELGYGPLNVGIVSVPKNPSPSALFAEIGVELPAEVEEWLDNDEAIMPSGVFHWFRRFNHPYVPPAALIRYLEAHSFEVPAEIAAWANGNNHTFVPGFVQAWFEAAPNEDEDENE